MRAPLLVVLLLAAGCVAPAGQPPGQTGSAPPETRECTAAAGAWILLERHTDHGGGDSEYWSIDAQGSAVAVAARPVRDDRTRVTFSGEWAEEDRQEVCGVMASFTRPDPHSGEPMHQSVRIGPQDVHAWRVDPERVRRSLEGFEALEPDSSAGCLSGGDTWMRVVHGSMRHSVEAKCAPDAAFGDVLASFWEAVNRRPFGAAGGDPPP